MHETRYRILKINNRGFEMDFTGGGGIDTTGNGAAVIAGKVQAGFADVAGAGFVFGGGDVANDIHGALQNAAG